MTLELKSADNEPMALAQRMRGDKNEFVIHDIHVPPGDYLLEVTAPASAAQPYVVRSVEVADEVADAEPNDGRERALEMDPSSLVTVGRLAAANDRDDWSFSVDAARAQRLLGVELTRDGAGYLNVCLFGPPGPPIKCRDGNGGLALSDLVLPQGMYVLEVTGSVDLASGYRLAVVDTGEPTRDRETEPNDRADTATAWDPALTMTGTLEAADDDVYRVTVEGPPELWSVDAEGTGLEIDQLDRRGWRGSRRRPGFCRWLEREPHGPLPLARRALRPRARPQRRLRVDAHLPGRPGPRR